MTTLSAEQRQRRAALSCQLRESVPQVKELPDGYAFRYVTDEGTWMAAAEFVELERRCCPFFAFSLEREPEGSAVTLKLTGHGRVKEFLATQIKRT